LYYDRRATDYLDKYQGDMVDDPTAVGAGNAGDKTNNQPTNQTEGLNPQGHFCAF